jgi:hypothetical protein
MGGGQELLRIVGHHRRRIAVALMMRSLEKLK